VQTDTNFAGFAAGAAAFLGAAFFAGAFLAEAFAAFAGFAFALAFFAAAIGLYPSIKSFRMRLSYDSFLKTQSRK
jgi:hypothetical protein